MTLTFGSLFSGIGGFDLGFEQAGLSCAWQVEIDAAARSVLATHWPNVLRYEDVRHVGRHNLQPVDVICGGFPCQDLSVAGKRAGLAGERSGLWFEFRRILAELRPRWVVIENVPGLLSSNGGADIQIIVDSLTQIGYTVDIDIKDAQEFGVAQRRRRVFLTCVRLDGLLRQRTPLSRQISADLLLQQLLNTWGAIPPALSPVPLRSAYEKPTERCEVSLRKMTALFEITQARLACKPSLTIWDVLLAQFGDAEPRSEHGSTASEEQRGRLPPARDTCESLLRQNMAGNGCSNTSTLLSSALAASSDLANKSITSTWTQETTDQRIFTFAAACLTTIARILPSLDWSANCWNVAQSASMLLQENMNYARQASRNLFIEPGLRDCWGDYLSTASCVEGELERCIGAVRAAEILPIPAGSIGHPAPRRETGQGVAGTLTGGVDGGRSHGKPNGSDRRELVAAPLTASGRGTERTGESRGQDTVIPVAYNVQHNDGGQHKRQDRPNGGMYVNATDTALTVGTTDLTCIAYPDPAYCLDDATGTRTGSGRDAQDTFVVKRRGGFGCPAETTDVTPTLEAQAGTHQGGPDNVPYVMAFAQNTREEVRLLNGDGQQAGALSAEPGMHQQTFIACGVNGTDVGYSLRANPSHSGDKGDGGINTSFAVAFQSSQSGCREVEQHATLDSHNGSRRQNGVVLPVGVRRLTPTECERLQGFPDGHTAGQSDSARYRQLGNAVCVSVARWLGQRIAEQEPSP